MMLRLFEHNEKAYKLAIRMMEPCGKTAIIHPTATNVRYLDNNHDMVEKLFDGYIASEITLGEVIARGILPTPKYVTTVYQYQKSLAKYQTRVDNLHTAGIQDLNQKYRAQYRNLPVDAIGMRWSKPDPWLHRYELVKAKHQKKRDKSI